MLLRLFVAVVELEWQQLEEQPAGDEFDALVPNDLEPMPEPEPELMQEEEQAASSQQHGHLLPCHHSHACC